MTREEFLIKLKELFPRDFDAKNPQAQYWLNAYKQVLSSNIEYDKLFESVICEYTGQSAPKPAWLRERAIYAQSKDTYIGESLEKLIYEVNNFEYEFWYDTKKQTKYEAREALEKKFKLKGQKYKFIEEVPTTNAF